MRSISEERTPQARRRDVRRGLRAGDETGGAAFHRLEAELDRIELGAA